ncbi:hypothetical protein DACRYDRAFT_105121 [Dacryopinax primogenitus]|uniref:Uncharacterized protein n=1 Tax=Dacryopinax primogenitus (strain DJM 731) TaxID=1858805 RepID=M5G1E9_DACPD|nr:uncharacterized protein DACRYDRAFT_105121 [Dacryopinax primogenitus]EJU04056.1 hypothetical protein DACRYDRAFT_105121 [Dacryopinax primogenitus]
MSANTSLPALYALYHILNPPLPLPFSYLPLLFRLLALSISAPFLVITLLEVAGYLVVRTLGFTRFPGRSTPSQTPTPVGEQSLLPLDLDLDLGLQSSLPDPLRLQVTNYAYFTSPSDSKLTGMFSPPDSREGSPVRSWKGLSAERDGPALAEPEGGGLRLSVQGRIGIKALTPVEAR